MGGVQDLEKLGWSPPCGGSWRGCLSGWGASGHGHRQVPGLHLSWVALTAPRLRAPYEVALERCTQTEPGGGWGVGGFRGSLPRQTGPTPRLCIGPEARRPEQDPGAAANRASSLISLGARCASGPRGPARGLIIHVALGPTAAKVHPSLPPSPQKLPFGTPGPRRREQLLLQLLKYFL